jgi:hypothetical protein
MRQDLAHALSTPLSRVSQAFGEGAFGAHEGAARVTGMSSERSCGTDATRGWAQMLIQSWPQRPILPSDIRRFLRATDCSCAVEHDAQHCGGDQLLAADPQ